MSLELTNMTGQVGLSKTVTARAGTLNEVIQMNGKLANGMYLLNVRSGADSKVFHVVIEQ